MKLVKYGIGLLSGLLLLSGCGNKATTDTIQASDSTVVDSVSSPKAKKPIKIKNGTKISVKDIEEYEKDHNGKNLTRRYIVGLLLDGKYPMNEKEVLTNVEELKKDMGDNYDLYLSENNLTEDTVGKEVKYAKQIHQLGVESLGITDKKLEDYYNSWVPSMTIQHIMVNDEETINEVKQKLDDGADFTTLVSEYSIDEQTKVNEGKWENLKKGDLLISLEEPVFQLQKGEVTAPIKTIMGWHIVKLLEPAEKNPYEEVKDEVKEDYISNQLTTVYLEEIVNNLLKSEISPLDDNLKAVLGIS